MLDNNEHTIGHSLSPFRDVDENVRDSKTKINNRNYYTTPNTTHRYKKDQIEGYFIIIFPMSPPTHRVLAHVGTRGYLIFPALSNCFLGMSVGFFPDSALFLLLLYSPSLADRAQFVPLQGCRRTQFVPLQGCRFKNENRQHVRRTWNMPKHWYDSDLTSNSVRLDL